MIRVAIRGLLGRKLRAALTGVAIVLGVAMISGTFVLTDTINAGFDNIFEGSYKNADAVVSGQRAFSAPDEASATETPSVPASVLAKIKRLPDVSAAAGQVTDETTHLIKRDGKVFATHGAPALGFSVDPAEQEFNPLDLVAGHWPHGSSEVAIDKASADDQNYKVGDAIRIEVNGPARDFEVAGIIKYGAVNSIGSATIAVFDTQTAQQLFNKRGQFDVIRVRAKGGISTAKLVSEIRPLLPPTAIVRDIQAQVKEDKKDVAFVDILQYALLAFGGIALFVGAFVIANTLSITIAQRMREFATMRTIGATRRQILRSVILEALVIGVVASVAGLFAGLGLAKGLNGLFVAVGIDLPKASTVFAERTIVVALIVGIVVTLLASLRPALRATRVPPIAAVREGAVLPRSRLARFGPATALTVLVVGVGMLVYGVLGHGIATGLRLLLLGLGVLLMFLGVALNAPRLVPPLASVLGWPGTRIGGAAGSLARDNAIRNPSRTASTAAALMIGLALVTFVAIFGAGLRSSFESAVDDLFIADYALTSTDTFTPLTVEAERTVRLSPEATVVSGIRAGSARYLGSSQNLTAVDANMAKVVHVDWKAGSTSVPAHLGSDGFFVNDDYAKSKHLHLGSRVTFEFPSGKTVDLKLKGIFKEPKGGSPFGEATISNSLFDHYFTRPENEMVLINTKNGVSDAATAALELPLHDFADADVQTRSQFKHNFEQPINRLLYLLYSLLALSVLISLFGIINTLVLTIFERTRELGMLRAVGMTRRQVRRMIRHESVVTSLIGGALGIVIGILLGLLVTIALSDQGIVFAVPYAQVVIFVLATIVVGILAAILPARRAARLNVLEALQYE
jgi:putative ABC transport system permease protein